MILWRNRANDSVVMTAVKSTSFSNFAIQKKTGAFAAPVQFYSATLKHHQRCIVEHKRSLQASIFGGQETNLDRLSFERNHVE